VRVRLSAALVVIVATVAPMLAGYGFDAATAQAPETPLGPGLVTVHLTTRYSLFSSEHLTVYQGTLVRFVVTNLDPIHHEFIVGGPAIHAQHQTGRELLHPPVPGEVAVDSGETGLTTHLFDRPGNVVYACHLPGHLAYGMRGQVKVIPVPPV
jgi:uncharacterized cupredoxin-like copper-binding protein